MVKILVRRIIAAIATAGSLAGLVVSLPAPKDGLSGPQKSVVVIAILAFGLELALAIVDYRNTRVTTIKRDENFEANIEEYMMKWLRRGGRVAIYSRDLTWASKDPIRELLLSKAKADELVLCVPSVPATGVIADLAAAGATTLTYRGLGRQPAARFTIINYGRADAEVAIGSSDGSRHRIVELRNVHDLAAVLSLELVATLESLPAEAR